MLDKIMEEIREILDDPIPFVFAMVGAYTVGKWLADATNAKRFLAVPDDVRRLT